VKHPQRNKVDDVTNQYSHAPRMAGLDGPGGLNDQVFNRLLRNRIVFLGQQVDDDIANTLCAQLLLLNAEDPGKDIWFYINSPGGSVTAGMAIYDTMQLITNDVATVRAPRASATRCRTPRCCCTRVPRAWAAPPPTSRSRPSGCCG